MSNVNNALIKGAHTVYTFGFVDDKNQIVSYQSPSWIIIGMDLQNGE